MPLLKIEITAKDSRYVVFSDAQVGKFDLVQSIVNNFTSIFSDNSLILPYRSYLNTLAYLKMMDVKNVCCSDQISNFFANFSDSIKTKI